VKTNLIRNKPPPAPRNHSATRAALRGIVLKHAFVILHASKRKCGTTMAGNGVIWLIGVSEATAQLTVAGLWAGPGHGETAVAAASMNERPAFARRI